MRLLLCLLALYTSSSFAQNNVVVQAGHTGYISCQLFETKRAVLLTGGTDGRIVQWEMKNGWQIGNINTRQTAITCMAFSPGDQLLATGGSDNTIVLVDYSTRQPIKRWLPFVYPASAIAFTPDGKYLVATSRDFHLWKCELATGKTEITKGEDDLLALKIAPDSKTIFFACRNGAAYKTDLLKGFEKSQWQELIKFEDEITEMDLSPDGKHLAIGTAGHFIGDENIGKIFSVLNIASKKLLYQVSDFDMSISPHYQQIQWIDNDNVLYRSESDSLKQFSLSGLSTKKHSYKKIGRFTYDINRKILAAEDDMKVNVYKNFSAEPSLVLEGKLSIPQKMWLASDSSLYVEYDNAYRKWDLRIGRLKTIEDKLYNNADEAGYTTSHTGRYIVQNVKEQCVITDTKYPDEEDFYPDSRLFLTHASVFSPHDRYLATISDERILRVFDTDSSFTATLVFRMATSNMDRINIQKMVFSPNEKYLAVLANDIYVFDIQRRTFVSLPATRQALYSELDAVFTKDNLQLLSASHNTYSLKELEDTTRKEVVYVPAGLMGDAFYLVSEPGVLKHWNVGSDKLLNRYFIQPDGNKIADATAMQWDDDGKTLFIGTSEGRLVKMDITTGNIITSIKDHNDLVFALQTIASKHLLISASGDGTIKIRDDRTLATIATLYALKDQGYAITDSSGYYKRSKNGAAALVIQYGDEVVQPEQYDLYFNQPHKVLQKIGMSSPGLIDLFKDLHKKKTASLNLEKDQPDLSRKIETTILNADAIAGTTDQQQVKLELKISAANINADMLFVTVNGVPVISGSKGIPISVPAGQQKTMSVDVPLAKGMNNISVKAYSEDGTSSAEQSTRINCKPATSVRPNLYVIVVSVSKYKDSSMNLKLATKDGQDFMNLWKKDGKKSLGYPTQFGNVYDYTFFNGNATRENILALKDTLAKARQEDMVILYLSGHGMLDSQYNFYYGTYDIDFSDPAKRGLSYTALESLLDDIKPLRKVMFMDACHSGAVDKSLIKDVSSGNVQSGRRSTIKEYSYGSNKVKEAKDLGNTFEQMQEMFNSFSRNSGTIVISAAAGSGFAYEDEKWNNGVFTYCLINGMRNKQADRNKDGDVTIGELSAYVSRQVELLTNGMQKPNERQENTKNSFRIW
jgi:WD40 repeat protein